MTVFKERHRRDEPQPPCTRDCPDRGKPGCHGDECPHGWKEYKDDLAEYRRKVKLAKEYTLYRHQSFDTALDRAAKEKKRNAGKDIFTKK